MITSILCLLILSASTCKKESQECHYDISIKNNSNDTVIYALKYTLGNDPSKCSLGGMELKPNETYLENSGQTCWEDRLTNGGTHDFYIVDPVNYNAPGVYYDCDSIGIKNKVLKHYVLTIDDLKNNNFTVTYP